MHYILKYDDNSVYPFTRLQYVYYRMALAAGIKMMPSELRTYGNAAHCLTQRFDRIRNERIHTQTLAAMMPESNSYEDIFAVMRRLNLPYEDMRQQYSRMVFNVLGRNVDDHSKNFAFCMTHDGVWRLSPAYDITYSVDRTAPAYMNRHSLTVNGKREDIGRSDLEAVAKNNDIHDYNSLIDDAKEAIADFRKLALEVEIDSRLIDVMESDFVKI